MKLKKVGQHLKQKLKDPYFREMHALSQQRLEIVKKIVDFRIKHCMSQQALAQKAGITQQHISKVEIGDFSNVTTVEKILLFIGYTIRMEAVPLSSHQFRKLERHLAKSKLKAA